MTTDREGAILAGINKRGLRMIKGRLCETLKEAEGLCDKLNGPCHKNNRVFPRKRFLSKSKYKYWVGNDTERVNGWYGAWL